MNSYRGRFAPSPSGWLHLGNARTAVFAWARARLGGGAFVMRVDDLDQPRTKPEAVTGNLAELAWLGIDWDEGPDVGGPYGPYRQSAREELYASAIERLVESGCVYECYLSRREIAELTTGAAGVDDAGEGPADQPSRVYGEAHRRHNENLAASRRSEGRPASLRFRVPAGSITIGDAVQGRVTVDLTRDVGDFVIRRADGQVSYQLATVVDDAAMRITEVARGADLLGSTAAQALIYRALGSPEPAYAHVGLLLDHSGEKLSKRGGSLSLHELRRAGARPHDVLGLLAATLGWLETPRPVTARELLVHLEDGPVKAPAGPVRLDPADQRLMRGVDS